MWPTRTVSTGPRRPHLPPKDRCVCGPHAPSQRGQDGPISHPKTPKQNLQRDWGRGISVGGRGGGLRGIFSQYFQENVLQQKRGFPFLFGIPVRRRTLTNPTLTNRPWESSIISWHYHHIVPVPCSYHLMSWTIKYWWDSMQTERISSDSTRLADQGHRSQLPVNSRTKGLRLTSQPAPQGTKSQPS